MDDRALSRRHAATFTPTAGKSGDARTKFSTQYSSTMYTIYCDSVGMRRHMCLRANMRGQSAQVNFVNSYVIRCLFCQENDITHSIARFHVTKHLIFQTEKHSFNTRSDQFYFRGMFRDIFFYLEENQATNGMYTSFIMLLTVQLN
jgi:hypothetical protein